MHAATAARAVAAARSIADGLGLPADGDPVVLHDSNKLTVRLLPCDVVARVAREEEQNAQFEVELARRLAAAGCPVAELDPRVEPRVHRRDGFTVTLWTHYATVGRGEIRPADYAAALARLHAGMRRVDFPTPSFTDRVAEAQALVASPTRTPALDGPDRAVLRDALDRLGQQLAGHGDDQLLHGEPHPGNLLAGPDGPLFIDLETCCRGPVEFDLAHAPDEVAEHYPGLDPERLRACRSLVLAMITTWRWDRDDQLPNGTALGLEWLGQLRAALARDG